MARLRADTFDSHRELMRESLFRAFDELLSERNYSDVTLADVAARAGMARNTIYNYASDKDALLAQVLEAKSETAIENVIALGRSSGPAPQRLAMTVDAVLRAFGAGAARAALLQEVSSRPDMDAPWAASLDEVFTAFKRILLDGIEAGDFRASKDIPLTITLIGGMLAAAARRHALSEGDSASIRDAVAEALGRMLSS